MRVIGYMVVVGGLLLGVGGGVWCGELCVGVGEALWETHGRSFALVSVQNTRFWGVFG